MTVQRSVTDRLRELESAAARFRMGEVTDTTPLTVTLGGSSTAYTDVMCIGANGPKTGDTVACLVFGNDLLVLGTLTGAPRREFEGIVNADGTEGGGDTGEFSVTKNGTGDYTITFTTAFSAVPAFTATPNANAGRFLAMDNAAPTASAVRIVVRNSAGTATDTAFHFHARGPA